MKQNLIFQNNKGFTLIEFMISMTIFVIILGATFAANHNQIRSYYFQKELSEMQQNTRAALFFMNQEIKKAGLDSTGEAGASIITADKHLIEFTMDFTGGQNDGFDNDDDGDVDEATDLADNNGNGFVDEPDESEWFDSEIDDPGEHIRYSLSNDANNNGINDGVVTETANGSLAHLQRENLNNPAGSQLDLVAYNIDALDFAYFDEDGNQLVAPVVDTSLIRTVQITIVGRTQAGNNKMMMNNHTNQAYKNEQDVVILPNQNDNVNRLSAFNTVFCRNLAL